MKQYKLAIFDMDGTLHNAYFSITKSYQRTIQKFCGEADADLEAFRPCIGPPLVDSLARFGLEGETLLRAADYYREIYMQSIDETVLYDGIPAMLAQLAAAGFQLAVASSKSEVVVQHMLDRDHIDHYFSAVGGLQQDRLKETKTEVIARVLSQFPNVTLSEAVMVGDREFDAIGAKDNGIDFVAAGYGLGTPEEFTPYPMAFYAKSPLEVAQFILGE